MFSAILSLAPTVATADYAGKTPGRCGVVPCASQQQAQRTSPPNTFNLISRPKNNPMKMHARPIKLHARLASPFGEANRPSFLEPILLFLFMALIGSLLEML